MHTSCTYQLEQPTALSPFMQKLVTFARIAGRTSQDDVVSIIGSTTYKGDDMVNVIRILPLFKFSGAIIAFSSLAFIQFTYLLSCIFTRCVLFSRASISVFSSHLFSMICDIPTLIEKSIRSATQRIAANFASTLKTRIAVSRFVCMKVFSGKRLDLLAQSTFLGCTVFFYLWVTFSINATYAFLASSIVSIITSFILAKSFNRLNLPASGTVFISSLIAIFQIASTSFLGFSTILARTSKTTARGRIGTKVFKGRRKQLFTCATSLVAIWRSHLYIIPVLTSSTTFASVCKTIRIVFILMKKVVGSREEVFTFGALFQRGVDGIGYTGTHSKTRFLVITAPVVSATRGQTHGQFNLFNYSINPLHRQVYPTFACTKGRV